ncbi:MAG TPA: histidine--tRNA ligase [Acidimicrobiales bacterium]
MGEGFQTPPGTHDVLAPESARWEAAVASFAGVVGRAGYGLHIPPMFEDVGVFLRVGETTDVISKEMYVFEDRGNRTLALRPEGTASVVRAFLQHGPPVPFKAWYAGPKFRYERAQAGRYRQHHQVGLECLGIDDPDVDVEVISLCWSFLAGLGLSRLRLLVNSLGDSASRAAYRDALMAHLEPHREAMGDNDRRRLDQNPLRVLDTKDPDLAQMVAGAPAATDHLTSEASAHFDRVLSGLDAAGIPYTLEPRLVRGLDYYTHTLFEVQADALEGAQSAVGGGGRYDGLAEALGGKPTPGVGFGIGLERTLLACDAEGVFPVPPTRVDVFVVDAVGGTAARDLCDELRRAGIGTDRAWGGRSFKAQFKAADRSGARLALVVGDDEHQRGVVAIRPLDGSAPQAEVARADVAREVGRRLDRRQGQP